MDYLTPRTLSLLACLFACCPPVAALEPDQLLLLVNRNVPESAALADFYANARLVPKEHILPLDLPRGEEMPFLAYEQNVVPAVRQFLRDKKLERKITCIVTFYGVPLRIANRFVTPADKQEIAQLDATEKELLAQIAHVVDSVEKQAAEADPGFKPLQGQELEKFAARADAAVRLLARQVGREQDPQIQQQRTRAIMQTIQRLSGPAGILTSAIAGQSAGNTETRDALKALADEIRKAAIELAQLQEKRFDPQARQHMRDIVSKGYGLIDQTRVIRGQIDYLSPGQCTAAFDSELALLWWNLYRRANSQPNALSYHMASQRGLPPTLMVMRLDAPQTGQVRDIILTSLIAERKGLKGKLVLDGRGIGDRNESVKVGSYAWYDQSIRNLADLVRTKTKLPLLYDESPTVLAAGTANDVAVYCGWYSLRNYVPACRFNPGAVGFHIASFEMVSLRNPNEKGWVRGLLNDGIASTLGSVDEPFLYAFPPADDFFPLLLTGKLTLAEVWWKTAPTTSWMMSMIGDPLYTPYKTNPALQIDDLPPRLRDILQTPSTQPAADRP